VVAFDPSTGSVLAMYSNPTYNPTPFTSGRAKVEEAAWKLVNTKDKEAFLPRAPGDAAEVLSGSTFKVITTAGIVAYNPSLLTMYIKPIVFTKLPDTTSLLYNDGHTACGGTVAQMLPASCDPATHC